MTKTKIALFAIPVLAAVLMGAMLLPAYSQEATVAEATVREVYVDIKPGSCPNPIITNEKGFVSVAVLGEKEFDVNDIEVGSLKLSGVSPSRVGYEDVSSPYTGKISEQRTADECTKGKKR